MLARMMRCHIWSESLLVGLGLILVSCGANTPVHSVTSPPLTPAPSPVATISPAAAAKSVAIAGCSEPSANLQFENPPGPLPTTIPLPPGTFVAPSGFGIQAGSVDYSLCTPTTTPAAITAYMDAALPAGGWMKRSAPGCDHVQGYPWYKGQYGMEIDVNLNPSLPYLWAVQICPQTGQG